MGKQKKYIGMKTTNAIVFDHRRRPSSDGRGQVEIRVTAGRKSYYFGTGIRCLQSEFVAGQVVNCPGAAGLNRRIAIIYGKVTELVNGYVERNEPVDTAAIRNEVWRTAESVSDEPTFLDWMAAQIPLLPITEGTRKHYRPLLARLEAFGRMRRWQDVTPENIMEFDSYLHAVTKAQSSPAMSRGQRPERLSDAGIYNYHKCLKALLNRADQCGKIERNPYERLRGCFRRGERESVEYLTEDEMRAFERLVLPPGSALETAHDLFVFQMYTGLPFSDAQAFRIGDYKWDGKAWNNTGKRIKTGVPYVSRLLPPAVAVLEKYGWKVPVMNNADYNRHLKALGQMAGIRTRIHSHLARHTFATFMLASGAKIENVSRMLGHTNITQTQRYAKVLAKSVNDDFDKIAAKIAAE
jgi:integrase